MLTPDSKGLNQVLTLIKGTAPEPRGPTSISSLNSSPNLGHSNNHSGDIRKESDDIVVIEESKTMGKNKSKKDIDVSIEISTEQKSVNSDQTESIQKSNSNIISSTFSQQASNPCEN